VARPEVRGFERYLDATHWASTTKHKPLARH
jgi:hypothetical protein